MPCEGVKPPYCLDKGYYAPVGPALVRPPGDNILILLARELRGLCLNFLLEVNETDSETIFLAPEGVFELPKVKMAI